MDMQMPNMNGVEATRAIRQFLREHGREQVPIVAMTANAFESDREAALDAGMNDFLTKPINIRQLEETLARYLKPCDDDGNGGTLSPEPMTFAPPRPTTVTADDAAAAPLPHSHRRIRLHQRGGEQHVRVAVEPVHRRARP